MKGSETGTPCAGVCIVLAVGWWVGNEGGMSPRLSKKKNNKGLSVFP